MPASTRSARQLGTSLLSVTLALYALSTLAAPGLAADVGMASFYGKGHAGKRTASGVRFNMMSLTAAHRTLPFGTRVLVTNLRNGKSVVVQVADRGPFRRGRVIDVSYGAAQALGFVRAGVTKVKVERF